MAKYAGRLKAVLGLDTKNFQKGIRDTETRVARFARGMRAAGARLSMASAALAAGTAAGVKSSMSQIDAQAKLAQSLGTTTSSMQVMSRAADLAGVSTSGLEQLSKDLTRRLSQAATGAGPAVKALDRLGLSAEDLIKMPLDQRIARINAALEEFVPEAERAAVAGQLFGEEGSLMAVRLDPGVIAQATKEIKKFGVGVSDIDADRIEEANDAISALGLVTRGLFNQMAVALAPVLKRMAERVAQLAGWFSNLSPEVKRMIGIAAGLAAALGPVLIAVGFLATGLAALASPIGLVVLGLGAAAGVAAWVVTNWDTLVKRFPLIGEAAKRVGGAMTALWEGAKEVWGNLFDAVKGAVSGIVALFKGDLTGAMDGFKAAWAGLKGAVVAAIDSWITAIDKVFPRFKQMVTDVVTAVQALPGKLAELGRQAVEAFVNAIVETWNNLKAKALAIFNWDSDLKPEGITGTAREMGARIGTEMAAGLKAGIAAQGPSTNAEIENYMKGVEASAKDAAEIKSPSRVFMRIGEQLMQGLGIGIAQNASLAQEAMKGAAETVADTAQTSLIGLESLKDGAKTVFKDVLTGARSFRESLSGVLGGFANKLLDAGINGLLGAIFPKFEGGGWTGSGPRTGGVDGKGGFPAILHPREYVHDTHAGGGIGGASSVAVHVTASFDETGNLYVKQTAQQAATSAVSAYDRQMPARVQGINQQPWRR